MGRESGVGWIFEYVYFPVRISCMHFKRNVARSRDNRKGGEKEERQTDNEQAEAKVGGWAFLNFNFVLFLENLLTNCFNPASQYIMEISINHILSQIFDV